MIFVRSFSSSVVVARSFTMSCALNAIPSPDISNNLISLAPSTMTTVSSLDSFHSVIFIFADFALSESTLIYTSSSKLFLKINSLENTKSSPSSSFSLSVIIVKPPETAIIFHPAFFNDLQASFAPFIIGNSSATC